MSETKVQKGDATDATMEALRVMIDADKCEQVIAGLVELAKLTLDTLAAFPSHDDNRKRVVTLGHKSADILGTMARAGLRRQGEERR